VLQLLIDHGANLECTDLHYGRPLHLAALRGHVRSAKVLLLAGNKICEQQCSEYGIAPQLIVLFKLSVSVCV